MTKSLVFLPLLALLLNLAACDNTETKEFPMQEQNGSGQSGEVTITPDGNNQVKVAIDITSGPAGLAQPAHIHDGTCANLGGIKHPLNNVVNGKSDTELNVDLSTLSPGPYAVNVHKSVQDLAVSVACADISP